MIRSFTTILKILCLILFTRIIGSAQEVPRNMVLTEIFVGTWSSTSILAVRAFEDLASNNSLAATITYLNLENLEYSPQESIERASYYMNGTVPHAYFDGFNELTGTLGLSNLFSPYLDSINRRMEVLTPVTIEIENSELVDNIYLNDYKN